MERYLRWSANVPHAHGDEPPTVFRLSRLHPFVDHWKVGKINYHKEIEDAVDWIGFRKEIVELFKDVGADYYLKKSLTDL